MAKAKNSIVLRQIRTLYNVGTIQNLGDGQLLERFTTDRGESAELAFAVLVERHGPMVLRVCRGVLSDWHDTEDAFQATFLVLVKKARGLWVRDSLGPWLHRVAFRTAQSARTSAARRSHFEEQAAVVVAEEPARSPDEVSPVIHEEIERLPERFRAPVVLCDLESRTHQQAARHLGWPIGTVKSRLARGRARLRDRLARRGLAPDAALTMAAAAGDERLITLKLSALIDSTARIAAGLGSAKSIAAGSIAALTGTVLRAMFIARWLKVAALALAIGAAGSGARVLATLGGSDHKRDQAEKAPAAQLPSTTVRPGKLHAVVSESGIVSTEDSWSIHNGVDGKSTLNWILPDKSIVKKGDLVGQLDSRDLTEQLKKQAAIAKAAEAAYQNARLTREVAEIAVVEYATAIADADHKSLQITIDAAGAAVAKAEARLARTRRASQRIRDAIDSNKGAATPADIMAELEIEDLVAAALDDSAQKKVSLAQAKARLDHLENETRPKTIKDLKAEVDRARAEELAKLATWNLEKARKEKLDRQIKNCNFYAPSNGVIAHANDTRFANRSAIFNGATVRERQIIFKMANLKSPLRVVTRVPAWSIAHVKPGVKVRLKADGIGERVLSGKVSEVAPLPDPQSYFGGPKVYTTWVRFDDPPAALVLDMNVKMEIDIADLDNVLTVPAQAILEFDHKDHVAVMKPAGGFEWRDVTLGLANAESVEVKKGLQAGDQVILEPARLRTEKSSAPKSISPTTPTAKKPVDR